MRKTRQPVRAASTDQDKQGRRECLHQDEWNEPRHEGESDESRPVLYNQVIKFSLNGLLSDSDFSGSL